MIALWSALASAQEPIPAEPPEPAPAEPAPAEPAPAPAPDPVPLEPAPEPVPEPIPEPAPEPELTDEPPPMLAPERDVPERRLSIGLELASLQNSADGYDLFSERNSMTSYGARIGVRPVERLEVRAAYHHIRNGAEVSVGTTDSYYTSDVDFEAGNGSLSSAFFGHEATLGLRVDANVDDIFFPYLAGDAMLFAAQLALDDEPDDRDNPTQVRESGVTVGGGPVAGIEVRLPSQGAQLAWTFEAGYTWLANASFGAFGDLKLGGATVRSGVGVRF